MIAETLFSTGQDSRRAAILGAAFDTFARYGFRRTSMEDIAQAAGLSRAALYLHFQNKQDILRSLAAHYFDVTESRMRAALQSGGKPKHVLAAAFDAKLGPELIALLDSPHGGEILDAKASAAGAVIAEGEGRLAALLADWLRTEAAAGRITLSPFGADAPALARTMVAALAGLKSQGQPGEALRAGARSLALLFARGLRP